MPQLHQIALPAAVAALSIYMLICHTSDDKIIPFSAAVVAFLPFYFVATRYIQKPLPNQRPATSTGLPLPPPSKVLAIRVYPIKSCRGIELESAKVLKSGLDLDRQWMFISASSRDFLTIRQISKMTLINTKYDAEADELTISIDKTNNPVSFTIPAHPSKQWLKENTKLKPVSVWGDQVDGYEYSSTINDPFSQFLGQEVCLVYKGPKQRVLRGNGSPDILGRKEETRFADLAPVQISNLKSMQELNSRLEANGNKALEIERFRPNIIIDGNGQDAWNEDVWKTVQILPADGKRNEVTIDIAARCARCHVPNVDPDTAVEDKRQPWDTLMKYRRVDQGITFKPCFGMLCVPREEGEVRVGDEVGFLEVTEQHRYIKGM